MKICVLTTNPAGIYSGGRYLSLILAHSLARAGADTRYVTNNLPLFNSDFDVYDPVSPLEVIVAPDMQIDADTPADWVVVIPTGIFDDRFYGSAMNLARTWRARIALLSFETPNWFNSVSPHARSPMGTQSWRLPVSEGGAVITIAREGIEPAREFYGEGREDLSFDYWHPPINDMIAARARPYKDGRKRVVAFVRVEDAHKGAADLLQIDPSALAGHTLSLVFGRGIAQDYVEAVARHFATAEDFDIELHDRITDQEKFNLLASASLLLFPSYFEGYGYPPVEAAWMGVPSVAYDLPLLHETTPNSTAFVPVGDTKAFSDAIARKLQAPEDRDAVRSQMAIAADTLSAGRNFIDILQRAEEHIQPLGSETLKGMPVPPLRGAARNLTARAFFEGSQGSCRLNYVRAEINGSKIFIQGEIEGDCNGRQLRFSFENAQIPMFRADNSDGESQGFSVEGVIEAWTSPEVENMLRVEMTEKGSAQFKRKVVSPVKIGARLLFERRAKFPYTAFLSAQGRPEALLAVPVTEMMQAPALALFVAAISEDLYQAGYPSRMVALDGDVCIPDDLETDFMPLVDRFDDSDPRAPDEAALEALAKGGLVVTTLEAARSWRRQLPAGSKIQALHAPEGVNQALALVLPADMAEDLAKSQEKELGQRFEHKAVQRARRSLLAHQKTSLLVLSATEPLTEISPETQMTLTALQARFTGLQVVLPARMAAPGALERTSFGGTGHVQIISETDLIKAIGSSARIAGLSLAGAAPDPLLQALLPEDAFASEQPDQTATIDALKTLLTSESSPFSRTLAELAPASANTSHVPFLNLENRSPQDRVLPNVLPHMTRKDGLILALPVVDHMSGLLEGWSSIDRYGAKIARNTAVFSFRVDPEDYEASSVLSVLLRVTNPKGEVVTLRVNGHKLGDLTVKRGGSLAYQVDLEPEVWSAGGTQYLTLHSEIAGNVRLMSVAIGDETPMRPDWSEFAPEAENQAPLRPRAFFQANIGNNQSMPGLRLPTGWHQAQADGCWVGQPMAALEFEAPILADGPALLRVEGKAFGGGALTKQRMGAAIGRQKLSAFSCPAGQVGNWDIVLPSHFTKHGVSSVFLEFPDITSPKSVGVGDDPRDLGLFASKVSLLQFERPNRQTPIGPDQQFGSDGAIELDAVPGLLRLSGPGTVPEGVGFYLAGTSVVASPHKSGTDRWEAWLPVSEEDIWRGPGHVFALREIQNGFFASLPQIDEVSIWPELQDGETIQPLKWDVSFCFGAAPADIRTRLPNRDDTDFPLASLSFAKGEGGLTALRAGWSFPEVDFVWSDGPEARLSMGQVGGLETAMAELQVAAFLTEGLTLQRQTFALGEAGIGSSAPAPMVTLLNRDSSRQQLILPLPVSQADEGSGNTRDLYLGFPDATSPQSLGLSADSRRLSLQLSHFVAHPPECFSGEVETTGATAAQDADFQVTLIGSSHGGVVLEVQGHGAAPYGLYLSDFQNMIVHPIPEKNAWRALLYCPIEVARSGQEIMRLKLPPHDWNAPLRGMKLGAFRLLNAAH